MKKTRYAGCLMALLFIFVVAGGFSAWAYSQWAGATAALASAQNAFEAAEKENARLNAEKAALVEASVPYDKFLAAWEPSFNEARVVTTVQQRIEKIAEDNKCKVLKPGVGAVDGFRIRGRGARNFVPSGLELEIKLSGEAWALHNAFLDIQNAFPHAQTDYMSFVGGLGDVADTGCSLTWNAMLPVYPAAPPPDGVKVEAAPKKDKNKPKQESKK